MSRSQRRLLKRSRLMVELLEHRALPSAAAPLDLTGLDGSALLSDPLFAGAEQTFLHAGVSGDRTVGPAGLANIATTPIVGSSLGIGPAEAVPAHASGGTSAFVTEESVDIKAAPGPQAGVTFVVASASDGLTSSGPLTLTDAIKASITKTSVDGSPVGTGNDTITFDPSLAGKTITVSTDILNNPTASSAAEPNPAGPSAFCLNKGYLLNIVGLSGPGPGITLAGGGAGSNFRFFNIQPTAGLTLDNLTITNFQFRGGNGLSANNAGGGGAGMGGAIFNSGTLTIENCTLSGNVALGGNGGHLNGFVTGGGGGGLGNDAFSSPGPFGGNNGGDPNGGAFALGNGGAGGFGGGGGGANGASLGGAAFSGGNGGFGGGGGGAFCGNGTGGNGGFGGGGGSGHVGYGKGGFGGGRGYVGGGTGPGTIASGYAGGGGAAMGGAIFNYAGTVTIVNSTLVGNSAIGGASGGGGDFLGFQGTGLGGALFTCNGTLTVDNSTLSGNSAATVVGFAGYGGAIESVGFNGGTATCVINSSILANSGTTDFVGTTDGVAGSVQTSSGASNLIQNNNGFQGTFIGGNPLVAALSNNGGPTPTLALLAGSPCLGKGANPLALTADQRGSPFVRTFAGQTDIGAFQTQPVVVATSAGAAVFNGTAVTVDPGVLVADANPVTSASVTITNFVAGEDTLGFTPVGNITGSFNAATGVLTLSGSDSAASYQAALRSVKYDNAGINPNRAARVISFTAADAVGTSTPATRDVTFPAATGVFFTDGINQLWLFTGGNFINTGAFAKVFSAGIDAQGNPECWFLDGNNQLFRFDAGVFTNTGAFASKIAAGKGFVAFTDGINQLFTFTDGGGFFNTGGFASRFTAGFDAAGNNQIVFADGINQLFTFDAATHTFTNTGAFTKLFVAGQDAAGNSEIWFTDGNNEIWRLDQGKFTAMGQFSTQIAGSAGGQMFFLDGFNRISSLDDAGTTTGLSPFALEISSNPGTVALFFSDGINQLWAFQNGTLTNTGGFASNFSAF